MQFSLGDVCDTLSQPAHGVVVVTGTTPGATALYVCDVGYRLSDPTKAQRTCGLHSVWSGEAPSCQGACVFVTRLSFYLCYILIAITCRPLTPQPHVAIALTNENSYGSVAEHTCDPGSIMIGGRERLYRHCQANGLWTDQPVFCYGTIPINIVIKQILHAQTDGYAEEEGTIAMYKQSLLVTITVLKQHMYIHILLLSSWHTSSSTHT